MNTNSNNNNLSGLLGAVWATAGFSLILLDAINRLSRIAFEAVDAGLTPALWAVFALVIVFMGYAEGYRGFQKSFSPRCAARTFYLYNNPDRLSVLLAPLFIMGFFRATRKPFLVAWVGTSMIIVLVLILHWSPQPWRGIVDAGVVVGLSWGLVSYLVEVGRVFSAGDYIASPEVA